MMRLMPLLLLLASRKISARILQDGTAAIASRHQSLRAQRRAQHRDTAARASHIHKPKFKAPRGVHTSDHSSVAGRTAHLTHHVPTGRYVVARRYRECGRRWQHRIRLQILLHRTFARTLWRGCRLRTVSHTGPYAGGGRRGQASLAGNSLHAPMDRFCS